MYGHSIAAALEWPGQVDLSGSQVLLDIGGGSGVHSIGAALKWPNLRAVVFDLPNACAVADEYVATHGLQQRVQTQAGDMWQDPFPAADIHLYSLVFPTGPWRSAARCSVKALTICGRATASSFTKCSITTTKLDRFPLQGLT
jgi:hypothetical protein